jgi:hypothetical protein
MRILRILFIMIEWIGVVFKIVIVAPLAGEMCMSGMET